MCRTKFYARAFLLTSYRAHQRSFELCKLAKRVANDRLHQHCRDVSKQYRTTRSGLQSASLQSVLSYFRTFGSLNILAHCPEVGCSGSPCCWWNILVLMRFLSSCSEQLAGTLFRTKRFHQQPTQPQLVYSAVGGRKCGRIPRTQPSEPKDATSNMVNPILCTLTLWYVEFSSRAVDDRGLNQRGKESVGEKAA